MYFWSSESCQCWGPGDALSIFLKLLDRQRRFSIRGFLSFLQPNGITRLVVSVNVRLWRGMVYLCNPLEHDFNSNWIPGFKSPAGTRELILRLAKGGDNETLAALVKHYCSHEYAKQIGLKDGPKYAEQYSEDQVVANTMWTFLISLLGHCQSSMELLTVPPHCFVLFSDPDPIVRTNALKTSEKRWDAYQALEAKAKTSTEAGLFLRSLLWPLEQFVFEVYIRLSLLSPTLLAMRVGNVNHRAMVHAVADVGQWCTVTQLQYVDLQPGSRVQTTQIMSSARACVCVCVSVCACVCVCE